MKVLEQKHSEQEFIKELRLLIAAGVSLLHVRSQHEPIRTLECLRRNLLADGVKYTEWDIVRGSREVTLLNYKDIDDIKADGNIDIAGAIASLSSSVGSNQDSEDISCFVFVNPQYWWEKNPVLNQLLAEYFVKLSWTNVKLIFLTPDIGLPEDLSSMFRTVTITPPSQQERLKSLDSILESIDSEILDISEEDKQIIAHAGAGLSRENYELYTSMAIVSANSEMQDNDLVNVDHIVQGIGKGKTELVKKNDLLELFPVENMENVGGMDVLKDWVMRRKDCYSQEAIDFGVEPPKGIVLAGLPGTGKSLVAKSIAYTFGVPLIKLDFGRVFNSLVGSSEQRIRTALSMVESMAPNIVLLDEVDKMLGGIGGSGDSGVSSRVLGTFLTWLQEHTAPCFVIITGNNIQHLPPELLRKGRMDAIFFTLLPTEDECLDILNIHLRKRKWEPSGFPIDERTEVARYAANNGYVAAEIETSIKDAIIECYFKGIDLNMDEVLTSLANSIPLSKTYKDRVDALTEWGEKNATPTSSSHKKRIRYTAKREPDTGRSKRRVVTAVSKRSDVVTKH